MGISAKGLGLIKEWEGYKNTVYKDSGGVPTIGVGHALTKSERASGKIVIAGVTYKYKDGLSNEQVDQLLKQDLSIVEIALHKLIKVELNQDQFDALASFIFNVGVSAFTNSTLLRKLNQREYNEVPTQLKRWVHDNGKRNRGLVNRRNNEIKLWNSEI